MENILLNDNTCYIYGVMLGDGYINRNKINRSYYVCLKVKDLDFAKRFANEIYIYTGRMPKIRKCTWKTSKQGFIYHVKISNKELYHKIIHVKDNFYNLFNNLDNNLSKQFLEGLYDSEGCVTDREFSNRIILNNRDLKLILLAKLLLSKFNIESHYYETMNKNKPYYELYVCTRDRISLFHKLIKFSILRKEERIDKILNSNHS